MNTQSYDAVLPLLPQLDALTEKVAQVHGGHTPDLLETRLSFEDLAHGILSLGQGSSDAEARGTAMASLLRLRKLNEGYFPPERACRSWRAMLKGLDELDAVMTPLLAAPERSARPDFGNGPGECCGRHSH